MHNNPDRLLHDPQFKAETGCDLQDEQLVVGRYDLEAVRHGVMSGRVPARPWSLGRIVSLSALTAAAVTWLLQPAPPTRIAPPQHVLVPEYSSGPDRMITPILHVEAPQPTQPVPTVEPEPTQRQIVPPDAPPPPPQVLDSSPAVSEKPQPPRPPPPAVSGLATELQDYNRALDAAESARWEDAFTLYSYYLQQWPTGSLHTEGQLGLLTATVHAGTAEQTERLADQLLHSASLSHRHQELRVIRAEALTTLHRCPEALALIGPLRRNPRTHAIKKICRHQTPKE